jgi:hypothetical protein
MKRLNNIDISDRAHRKLKGKAASMSPKVSLRAYCAHVLEQHTVGKKEKR